MKPRDIHIHPCVKTLEGTIQGLQSEKWKRTLVESESESSCQTRATRDVTAKGQSAVYALRRIELQAKNL